MLRLELIKNMSEFANELIVYKKYLCGYLCYVILDSSTNLKTAVKTVDVTIL